MGSRSPGAKAERHSCQRGVFSFAECSFAAPGDVVTVTVRRLPKSPAATMSARRRFQRLRADGQCSFLISHFRRPTPFTHGLGDARSSVRLSLRLLYTA